MTTLNAVLTHLPAAAVDEHLALLRGLAPGERFVVLHGGPREEFARIAEPERAWIADPSWRGPARSFQSYHEILGTLHDRWLAAESELDAVHLFEFDHVPLAGDFAVRLRAAAEAVGADLLAKRCVPVNQTNWPHYGRFRRDPALRAHLDRLSTREDPSRMYGMLASGVWLTRAAVEAYVGVADHPPCYGELYVPTLLHHLGLRVADGDAAPGGVFAATRWEPAYDRAEAELARAAGAPFAHPVKDAGDRGALLAVGAASYSESAPRPSG